MDETAEEGTPRFENLRITTPAAQDFLAYLKDVVLPWAEAEFGSFRHRVLFGYSFGGIFTLQALFQEPELFHSYIAGSPSLWYEYDFYAGIAIAAQANPEKFAGRCLIMSAGEDEPSINSNTRKFQNLIAGLELPLMMHYQRNIEVDHSHNRLISFLYGWDKIFNMDDVFPPAEALKSDSLASFNKFARTWSKMHSCAPFALARSAPAYAAFVNRLVAQENWSELQAVHEYVLAHVPIDSSNYGAFLGPMLAPFKKLPSTDKDYWAKAYQNWMATRPRPGLAIHFISVDVLEYLADADSS